MSRLMLIIPVVFALILATAETSAQTAGSAGAFARMGFHARGIGLGNALTAVTTGEIVGYYNPAVSAFAEERSVAASFGILSFDRSLNFLSYTQPLPPHAGLSLGLIHAGVRKIDGRDNDGIHTEVYSTMENQFFLSFSNRLDERVSIGVAIKLYHSRLFEDVKSTTVGFDLGACARVTNEVSIGAALQDVNSKYKWDSKSIYGSRDGRSTDDRFPTLRRIGIAYALPTGGGIVTVDFENSSLGSSLVRFGAEYSIVESFRVRGGLDRFEFGDDATGAKPSFGFSLRNHFNGWAPTLTYAFVVESFAPAGIHLITLSSEF